LLLARKRNVVQTGQSDDKFPDEVDVVSGDDEDGGEVGVGFAVEFEGNGVGLG